MKIPKFLKITMLCLFPVTLFCQVESRVASVNIMDVGVQDLATLLRRVSTNIPATIVLLDSQEKDWEEPFKNILREDPFALMNLTFISLSTDQGAGNELREREGWQEKIPHWAILSPEGRIVAHGASLPTSTQLAEACYSARIVSKAETYRQFLREHPNHEETRRAMLQEMLEVAEKRTRYALQVPESTTQSRIPSAFVMGSIGGLNSTINSSGSGDPTAEQIENLPELTSEADERIWGNYCSELRRYLEGITWQSSENSTNTGISSLILTLTRASKPITSAWGIYSPLTRETYSRIASKVEEAMTRQPSSTTLWQLWVSLQKTRATRSMAQLLADLEPSPTVPATNWPPESVRTDYIRSCREIGDWKAILDLVEPIWEMQKALIERDRPAIDGARNFSLGSAFFNQSFWTSSGEAYLEALLMQGRLTEAEQMMRTWESVSGWSGAFTVAANLAEKLGHENTAKVWRELGEKAPPATSNAPVQIFR